MRNSPTVNLGEGNPEAARRFNKAEAAFVDSARGKQRIRAGVTVQRGKARARDKDVDGL